MGVTVTHVVNTRSKKRVKMGITSVKEVVNSLTFIGVTLTHVL